MPRKIPINAINKASNSIKKNKTEGEAPTILNNFISRVRSLIEEKSIALIPTQADVNTKIDTKKNYFETIYQCM